MDYIAVFLESGESSVLSTNRDSNTHTQVTRNQHTFTEPYFKINEFGNITTQTFNIMTVEFKTAIPE